jgi:hypothetical protein
MVVAVLCLTVFASLSVLSTPGELLLFLLVLLPVRE